MRRGADLNPEIVVRSGTKPSTSSESKQLHTTSRPTLRGLHLLVLVAYWLLIVWLTYFGYYYNIILLFLVTLFWLLIGWLTYFGCTHLFCADSIGSKKIERRGGGILRWRWWSSGIRGSLDRSGSAPAVAAATASASILAL